MTPPQATRIGPLTLDPASGELIFGDTRRRLEPKTLELLLLLAASPARVFSKEEIFATIWPGVTVGEDTLARTVSKLRKALGDDPKSPRFIETIPKRGYRFVASAETASMKPQAPIRADIRSVLVLFFLLLTVAAAAAYVAMRPVAPDERTARTKQLIARADDFYFQYTPSDTEAAIALYERIVEADPDDARALSGLANALVQRAMRWPLTGSDLRGEITTLGEARSSGRLAEPAARRQIERASMLATEAVRLAPRDAQAHKALGLALSASGDFERALAEYKTALDIDPGAWGVLINVGDVLEITGKSAAAMPFFERAYSAMSKAYASESARVRPWQARLGVGIGDRYRAAGDPVLAEKWYREVLTVAPLDREATIHLASLLTAGGSADEAARLCRDLADRTGGQQLC